MGEGDVDHHQAGDQDDAEHADEDGDHERSDGSVKRWSAGGHRCPAMPSDNPSAGRGERGHDAADDVGTGAPAVAGRTGVVDVDVHEPALGVGLVTVALEPPMR
jgi:hypothetical protein